MDEPLVTFVERTGAGAADLLADLARRLAREGASARLLVAADDPDRVLLVVEGDPSLAEGDRQGARVWRFREPHAAGGGAA